MELKEYLNRNKIKVADFAKKVDCTQGYISLICAGKRKPGADIALKIQAATGNQVTIRELRYPNNEKAA